MPESPETPGAIQISRGNLMFCILSNGPGDLPIILALTAVHTTSTSGDKMNINDLIPLADTIPVHWGWLEFFLILTFTLHLILMNLMLGSGIFCCFHGSGRKKYSHVMVKETSKKLPFSIAFTVNFGVAPLLFLQVLYGNFIYVSSILMAVFWLSIIFILIAAYYLAYVYDFYFDQLPSLRTLLIISATLCMLVIGFFISNNMTLMVSPHVWPQYFENRLGTILAFSEPMLIPRYLHFVFSSTAVAGLFQAWYWDRKEQAPETREATVRLGLKWFTHSTLAQIPVGFWFLMALPSHAIQAFMGRNPIATALLVLGIVLTGVSLYQGFRGRPGPLTITMLLLIITMVLVRDQLRIILLDPYFRINGIPVHAQYSPMILFIISLIIGLGLVAYMISILRNQKEGGAR